MKFVDTNYIIKELYPLVASKLNSNMFSKRFYDNMGVFFNKKHNQINDIVDQKKRALSDFETTTKVDITNQIKAGYIDSINKMKAENEIAYDEQRTLENRIKTASLEISQKYEAYVGKENLSAGMIDSLIEIINGGDAVNIADALAFYKKTQGEGRKPVIEKATAEKAAAENNVTETEAETVKDE